MTKPIRIFFDPASRKYIVAHLELDPGEQRVLNTLFFEAHAGEPLGSIPLDPALSLADLSTEDLVQLFTAAGPRTT